MVWVLEGVRWEFEERGGSVRVSGIIKRMRIVEHKPNRSNDVTLQHEGLF